MKKFCQNICVAALALLLCLLVGEAVVRCSLHFIANYNYEMWRYAAELKQPLPGAALPFHHRPGKSGNYYGVEIRTNSLGMRDPERTITKPAGCKRVLFLGDSYTLGWGVPAEATFPRQLEQMLNRDSRATEVINMGVGNYNSSMEVELFKLKGLEMNPDLVVLMYYINDVEPTPQLGRLGCWLQQHFYLLGYIRLKMQQLVLMVGHKDWLESYYRKIYNADAPGLRHNAKSIRELFALCRSRNIKLLVVNIPDLRRLKNYPFSYATEFIRGIAEENRVPFLDLLPVLERFPGTSLWVSGEDSHANARANTLVSGAIFNKIKSSALLNGR